VIPFQPHFIGQPEDVSVVWGYALAMDQPGNFVAKKMAECTGREIMQEVLGHFHITTEADGILGSCMCIPCTMPFITSQFLRRDAGDRPAVIPEHTRNLGLVGQFCELPGDVVFTVEYSIRSAQNAVASLLRLERTAPPMYEGIYDPRVLYQAFRALHNI
jgi:oleate hydratase